MMDETTKLRRDEAAEREIQALRNELEIVKNARSRARINAHSEFVRQCKACNRYGIIELYETIASLFPLALALLDVIKEHPKDTPHYEADVKKTIDDAKAILNKHREGIGK